ncbi:hypothetical protein AcW1_005794 [Taiwanofungus camphoratus]|nr:hypothetical protein AcV5_006118 [Antrodia cinnamomea]KAI0957384.1 hypothetical protein AcW1_005794 [Antrodia cinnamomea]
MSYAQFCASILSRSLGSTCRRNAFQTFTSRNWFSQSSVSPLLGPVGSKFSLSRSVSTAASNLIHASPGKNSLPLLYKAAGVAGVGLGLSIFAAPKVFCEPIASTIYPLDTPPSPPGPFEPSEAPPPASSVNYYELGFGTVCGICAGVFVKKGAKALAFIMGGVFVLLQYLGSLSLVRVDWARASARFENLFYTTDRMGTKRPPTISSLFKWIVNFLTANFQERASFIAGLALGLRLG